MPSLAHTWAEPDLYILADDDLIAECRNAMRRQFSIEKEPEPVIRPDKPWEGLQPDGSVNSLQDPFYGTVLYDPSEGIFRAWYNVYDRFANRMYSPPVVSQGYSCRYAVSEDGVNWEKPEIGEVSYDGSLRNNILRFKGIQTEGTSCLGEQIWNVVPYGPECASAQTDPGCTLGEVPHGEDRFVASLQSSYPDPLYTHGITMCYSPDGIHWRMHFPPVLTYEGDCHGFCWDPVSRSFLLTTRSHEYMNLCRRWGRQWKRHIALFRSRDLVHWTAATTILEVDEKDPEDAQLYLMYIIPYGHVYLGQLLMFYTHEMTLDVQLALSRDLLTWKRMPERTPMLERGEEGAWDCRHVALTHNPPHPMGGRMRFWYAGKNAPHYQAGYGALGTGTLRRDGFVCYEAGEEEGVVTTIPFRPPKPNQATHLILNVDASNGEVLAEVTDVQGSPIEGCTKADCAPVRGDHIRTVVNFRAGPGQYFSRGNFMRFAEDVRFRFYLRNARLYAVKVANYEPQWP